jgi:MCP family monocarboxylic acid transporter-like MFS transporter 10
MAAGCGISILGFWTGYPLPEPVIVIGLVLYGYTSGAWITLVAPSTGAISPVKELGMRVGMLWSIAAIAVLAGPVACGRECH